MAYNFKIIVPSYCRSDTIKTHFAVGLPNAYAVVPESQYEDYKGCGMNLVKFPDELEGNLPRKRNWIMENLFDDSLDFLVMSDDDVVGVDILTDFGCDPLSQDEILEMLCLGYDLSKFYGVSFFGFSQRNRFIYKKRDRLLVNAFVDETVCGYLDRSLREDEKLTIRADVDLYFRLLIRDGGVLRINFLFPVMKTRHGVGEGGLRSVVDRNRINKDNEIIIGRYGERGRSLIRSLSGEGKTNIYIWQS